MSVKKVKITTDSTVDFTPEIVEKYDITVMPLYIVTDEGEYRDTLDITPDDVYAYYDKCGKTATSSACNLDAYSQKFKELTDEGYAVVHIGLSSELSSSFNNARMAAMEFEDVYVVDSLNLSTGIGLLVLKAAEMASEGMEAKEIAEKGDKKRRAYHDYYANSGWGVAESYDLCINSSRLGIEGSVEIIHRFIESRK